jgi:hypothetical protein
MKEWTMPSRWPKPRQHFRSDSTTSPTQQALSSRRLAVWVATAVAILSAVSPATAQVPVTTWRYSNAITGANTNETMLTPANVNPVTFGKRFSQPVDGIIVGHPLYMPNLNLPGQGIHNVVFVATMHDSVYAFDANTPNIPPLWQTSLLSYSPGAAPMSATLKRNASTTGWTEVGVVSTPVIDPSTKVMYVVAETYEGNHVVHRLHALDITTGLEVLNGPTTITASVTQNGVTSVLTDLYDMNRPGLLLVNGHIYIAWGSNCCNAPHTGGWVLSYNEQTLQQEGVFDVEPGKGLASIWQKGAGLSSDSSGAIYGETGEGFYSPGVNLSESVLKLSQVGTTLTLADWFTPFDYSYLSANDLDLAHGVVILPDQPGLITHELVSIGKVGTIYLLNRDKLGQLCTTCGTMDTQIVQEFESQVPGSGTPVYWNNQLFFDPQNAPMQVFTLSNGNLTMPPATSSAKFGGGGHGIITANGNTNGVFWYINTPVLFAVDAQTLKQIYSSKQAANGRDTLPLPAHFATPIEADGQVFVGTTTSLVVYGLLPALNVTKGNQQSGQVGTTLAATLQVQAKDPYSPTGIAGITVTFSDGAKGGSFLNSPATTDSTGTAATSYTLPQKTGTYTITVSAPGFVSTRFTETATSGLATQLVVLTGNNQSTTVGTPTAASLVTRANDALKNPVPGVAITYADGGVGGSFSAKSVTTNSAGNAPTIYTAPTKSGKFKITASATGATPATFVVTATAGPAANENIVSGNNQTAPAGTQLPQALVVSVTDQYGNAVANAAVTYSDGGAGGTFSADPVITATNGSASVTYTGPSTPGPVTVTASLNGVATPARFTETFQ